MRTILDRAHRCLAAAPLLLLLAVACDSIPTRVAIPPSYGKGGPNGGNPVVKSTVPGQAPRNTTLDVRVLGSGFTSDAEPVWALDGDTVFAATRIRTNSTRFVSSGELVANVTIAVDAQLELYDVVVVLRSNGKKGIGIELFEVTYEQIDLGFGRGSQAFGVNDRGQVVGWGPGQGGARALLWENGVVTDLGVLPGMTAALARDVNENGEVVGYSHRFESDGRSVERGFVWTQGAGMTELATLGGRSGQARAISDAGDIVGHSTVPGDAAFHATLWRAGAVADLHGSGGGNSWAADVNDDGVVVGVLESPLGRSFRWTEAAGLQFLRPAGSTYRDGANGLNTAGQVVGFSEAAPGQPAKGYVWTTGVVQTLPSSSGSSALAVNDLGQVAGHHFVNVGAAGPKPKNVLVSTAFIWDQVGPMRALTGQKQPRPSFAYAVNRHGWVVGDAELGAAGVRAVVWKIR